MQQFRPPRGHDPETAAGAPRPLGSLNDPASHPLLSWRRSLVTLFLAWGVAAPSLAAQAPSLDEEWRWVHFGIDEGLPTGGLIEILESGDTPWLVTVNALTWFDGFRWNRVAFPPNVTRVQRLVPDGSGGAYGVGDGRIVQVARDSVWIVHLPVQPVDPVRWVTILGRDTLVFIAGDQVFKVAGGSIQPVPVPATARPVLAAQSGRLLRTRAGHVFLLAGGTFRWDENHWTEFESSTASILRETEAGGLLVVADPVANIRTWKPGGRPETTATSILGVEALSIDPLGEAIVAFPEGRLSVRHEGAWRNVAAVPSGLHRVRQLVHRANGDLWALGPYGLSLFRASARRWTHQRFFGRNEFTGFINAILRTTSGELWMGTGSGVIVQQPDGTAREITSIQGRALGVITGLGQDVNGAVWISSGSAFDGAFRWDGDGWRHITAANGLPAPRVHAIERDSKGNLWFLGLDSTTAGGPGAFIWDGARFTPFGPAEGLPSGRVYAFAEAQNGTRWFGTAGGLSRWKAGVWTHWPVESDSRMRRIYAVAVDTSGRPWFGQRGQSGGLGTVDDGDRVQWYPTGAPGTDEIASITRGPDGTLWLGTGGGLGIIRDGTLAFLREESGLRPARIWPVLPLADRVLVGGDGLFSLDLSERGAPPPTVEVSPPVTVASEVLLRWTALAYWGMMPPDHIETRYRVDGGPWTDWSLSREASLFSLRPGRHTVEVAAKGLFGDVSGVAAAGSFTIPRPWYLGVPFLVILAAAGAAVTILAALYLGRMRAHRRSLELLNQALAADVENRRTAEIALRESQRFSQQLADSLPAVLLVCGLEDGLVAYVNPAFDRIVAGDGAQLLGRSVCEMMGPDDREALQAIRDRLRAVADGEIVEQELRVRDNRREQRVLAVRATAFRREGTQTPQVLAVAQDVTDHRNLQEQLAHAQKMESVGRLAGGVAHDFNNLLTAIVGYTDLAREGLPEAHGVREDLEQVSRAAARARSLTSQLLAFARRQLVEPRVFDPNELIVDLERMLRRLIGEDVRLVTRLTPGAGPVRMDPSQLEQVLVNLAVNARDAMPAGGTLTLETEHRPAPSDGDDASPGPDRVIIHVRDTGTGMTPEVLSNAFEPFFTTKEPGKGTGLGLSTCYGILQQAGGSIRVTSVPGMGTRFTISLPRADEPVQRDDPRPPARTPPSRGSETILLVEDESQVRALAERSLTDHGYRVLTAANGLEALNLLESHDDPVDLLVSDLVMPGMGGIELWDSLRHRLPALCVLFISGYTDSDVVHQGLRDNTLPFLAKPFSPATLVRRIREILDGENRTASR